MTASKPYRISVSLAGHSADVRSLSSSPHPSNDHPTLFSSSRDGTARSWFRSSSDTVMEGNSEMTDKTEGGADWKEGSTFTGQHDGFVNAVKWLKGSPSSEGSDRGYLVTAGQDSLIHVWPLPSSNSTSSDLLSPSHTLLGHSSNVCALDTSEEGDRIISGSWDKTAKVWSTVDFSLVHTLEGHDQAVWAVLALSSPASDLVLTGAADNLIKLWKGDKSIRTFKGHTQAVRALAKLAPGVGGGNLFASAGNDATIRLWNLDGDAVAVLNGHDSFIYSLSAIPDSAGGGLISGGEDRTVRVWKASDGECEQTIVIPAVSVWTVNCLPNGDIAAGASDGIVRIFTRAEDRVADLDTLMSYDQQVSKTALNSTQVGDVKKNDLPGIEALDEPGKKEGQVIIVKANNGTVEAHQWSSSSRTWQKIGEVVDAVGSNRKQLYLGQEYDHVFDVDFKDGAPPLKLPYNVTENPYEAAQKFLFANELPQEYIDEVVKFIEKSTNGATLGTGSSEFVDPYTGASRYTGGGSGSTPAPQTGGFSGDPYTGGGRTTAAIPNILPYKTLLSFLPANLAALRTKLVQLNDGLALNPANSSLTLSVEEVASLDNLIAYLLAAPAAARVANRPKLAEAESAVALKLLQWPDAQKFPGLDLIRLVSLYSPLPESIPALLQVIQTTIGSTKELETNSMLAFRAIANFFISIAGKSLVKDEAAEIIDTLSRRGITGVSKNGKIALATIILNYSVLAVSKNLEIASNVVTQLFDMVIELLRDADGEVVYRTLIALGNLLLSPQIIVSLPAAALQRFKTLSKEAGKRLPEVRIKAIVVEIQSK